jgi:hypothetical protein
VLVGHLLYRIEQHLTADALARATVPRLEYRFGYPMAAYDIQYRHSGINARQAVFRHIPRSISIRFISRHHYRNQIPKIDLAANTYRKILFADAEKKYRLTGNVGLTRIGTVTK